MSISGHTNGQQPENKNVKQENSSLKVGQQKKRDAMELAELIYNIFNDSLSSATIEEISIKENDDV